MNAKQLPKPLPFEGDPSPAKAGTKHLPPSPKGLSKKAVAQLLSSSIRLVLSKG